MVRIRTTAPERGKRFLDLNFIKKIEPEEEDEYADILNAFTVDKEQEHFLKRYEEVFEGYG